MSARKNDRRHDPIKTIWNVFTWTLITTVVMTAIALVGVRLFGLQPYSVLSGSMEPTYKTGSIIYVKKVDYQTLAVGDPITFMLDEKTIATHRIVETLPDKEDPDVMRYRTKGDNNETVDVGLVHCRNVIGKPVFTIPYLGYAAYYIQHPPGIYIVASVCAILILMTILPIFFQDKDEKE